MLYVKTTIERSDIHWLWLFADQEILKGELIGEFTFWLDISLSEEEYQNLNKKNKEFFDAYGREDKITKKYMLNIDNTRFINHSKNPNIAHQEYKLIAARDIKQGEELTDNYTDFDNGFATRKL